jgi:hypothetical protein
MYNENIANISIIGKMPLKLFDMTSQLKYLFEVHFNELYREERDHQRSPTFYLNRIFSS